MPGLPQIVHRGPDKFAQDIRRTLAQLPKVVYFFGESFRAIDNSVGMIGNVPLDVLKPVIVTGNIEENRRSIVDLSCAAPAGAAASPATIGAPSTPLRPAVTGRGRIEALYGIGQLPAPRDALVRGERPGISLPMLHMITLGLFRAAKHHGSGSTSSQWSSEVDREYRRGSFDACHASKRFIDHQHARAGRTLRAAIGRR